MHEDFQDYTNGRIIVQKVPVDWCLKEGQRINWTCDLLCGDAEILMVRPKGEKESIVALRKVL
jgi:hypothetical protein